MLLYGIIVGLLQLVWLVAGALQTNGYLPAGMSFFAILVFFELVVLLQFLLAWEDRWLTPRQMQEWGVPQGLPLVAHGAMWSDLIVVSPLCAAIVACHIADWGTSAFKMATMVIAGLVGLLASSAMHESYKKGTIPEAHVRNGQLTEVGWVHHAYMGIMFGILLMYFLAWPYSPWMWPVAGLLSLHAFVGNHMILGGMKALRLIKAAWYSGRPLRSTQGWASVACTIGLAFGVTALRAFHVW